MSRPTRLPQAIFDPMALHRQTRLHAVKPAVYEVRHLIAAEIGQAFPLVREIASALSMADWQRYVGRSFATGRGLRREHGIIGALQHGSIYLRGLCTYRLVPDLTAYDRRMAGCFAVPKTIDCVAVARALIAACRSIAESFDCSAVQFQLVERNQWIASLLREAGYSADQRTYVVLLARLT